MNENNQNNVNNVNNMNNDEINPSTDINTNTDTNANVGGNIETDSTQDSPQPSTATATGTGTGTVEVAARGELWTVKFSRMATSLYHHGAPVPVVSTYNIFVLSSASSYTLSVFLSIYQIFRFSI